MIIFTPFRQHANQGIQPCRTQGFTMIEIMFVLGIAAMIMAIGIPSIFQIMRKDPMRQAVSDMVDGCSEARAQAILKGVPAELVLNPSDASIRVVAGNEFAANGPTPMSQTGASVPPPSTTTPAKRFTAKFSEDIAVQLLEVNNEDRMAATEETHVRFFPNGTSDDFKILLYWASKNQWRAIRLDIITGLPDVEIIQ